MFVGILVASFISDIIAYSAFANNALGLNDAVACVNFYGVEYDSNYYIVPPDNGKIPSIEELVSQLAKYSKNIR